MPQGQMPDPTQVALFSTALDIGIALVALGLLWLLMRLADWAAQHAQDKHGEGDVSSIAARGAVVIERIESQPMSAAIYYTGRWVGGCIVLGMILG